MWSLSNAFTETFKSLDPIPQFKAAAALGKFLAAVNGPCAGGGYELALACDEIVLVDDRSSTVSFPEVPLLAVLPGTGGLTRLVDKRKVRLEEPIREIGTHMVEIELADDTTAAVKTIITEEK